MNITQKIHGSNGHILIHRDEQTGELDVTAASRTRYLSHGKHVDNFGFAAFCQEHKVELIERLGEGRHDGEWAGPGINHGEGLTERTFVLFDFWRYPKEKALPAYCRTVPVLYVGRFSIETVHDVMSGLKNSGSHLVPGFMRPEGVVVQVAGIRYKQVFEPEQTRRHSIGHITPPDKSGAPNEAALPDYQHLLQPMRLEKLLSRDESYSLNYPSSLGTVVKAYFQDLIDDGMFNGPDNTKAARKKLGTELFRFVRAAMENKGDNDASIN